MSSSCYQEHFTFKKGVFALKPSTLLIFIILLPDEQMTVQFLIFHILFISPERTSPQNKKIENAHAYGRDHFYILQCQKMPFVGSELYCHATIYHFLYSPSSICFPVVSVATLIYLLRPQDLATPTTAYCKIQYSGNLMNHLYSHPLMSPVLSPHSYV